VLPLHCGPCGKTLARHPPLRFDRNQRVERVSRLFPSRRHAPVITDPLFYLLAVPAITALGLGKGGFAGVGMISTPLLALTVPPLQAAAILLPILLCQDVISVWVYRRQWSAWKSQGAAARCGDRRRRSVAVRRVRAERLCGDRGWCDRCLLCALQTGSEGAGAAAAAERRGRMFWGSLAGFTSTIIQIGAPPYQAHILPQRLDKLTLIGTTIIFFALVNVMKLVPYFALGQFSPRTLATSVVLLPFAVAANFSGAMAGTPDPDRGCSTGSPIY